MVKLAAVWHLSPPHWCPVTRPRKGAVTAPELRPRPIGTRGRACSSTATVRPVPAAALAVCLHRPAYPPPPPPLGPPHQERRPGRHSRPNDPLGDKPIALAATGPPALHGRMRPLPSRRQALGRSFCPVHGGLCRPGFGQHRIQSDREGPVCLGRREGAKVTHRPVRCSPWLLSPSRAITDIQTIKIATVVVNRNPVAAILRGQVRTPNGLATDNRPGSCLAFHDNDAHRINPRGGARQERAKPPEFQF
jgi:hypothetical protein